VRFIDQSLDGRVLVDPLEEVWGHDVFLPENGFLTV
jgi:hypothetical protein